MKYWQTEHFAALQRAWYQRLRDEGFQDAEEKIADDMVLRQCAEHPYRECSAVMRETKEEYYALLSHHVETAPFDSTIDRMIMTMYAQGAAILHISRSLRSMAPRHPPRFVSENYRSARTILHRIRVYEMRWGLRHHDESFIENYKRCPSRQKSA